MAEAEGQYWYVFHIILRLVEQDPRIVAGGMHHLHIDSMVHSGH